jgi:hypothetical protein
VIAIPLLTRIARSANERVHLSASTSEAKVDSPTHQPAVEISDDATATWRRSYNESANDVRFVKPRIPGRAQAPAPARALATDGVPASESIPGYYQRDVTVAQNMSVKRIEVNAHAATNKLPAQVPAIVADTGISAQPPLNHTRQLAGATAAKLQQLIELPQIPAVVKQPNQAVDGGEIALGRTNAQTQFQEQNGVYITNEPNDVADTQVVQTAASGPRQLWATGVRLLQEIGQLFPVTGSKSAVAQ